MTADRIFLFRKMFVALALLIVVAGLTFAQYSGRNATAPSVSTPTGTVSGGPAKAVTFNGENVPLGKGLIRSWVRLDGDGKPSAVGVTFTEEALKSLPQGAAGKEYVLSLPPQAAATAINHIVVDWNSQGHEPARVYDVAHFDFHFYTITPQEREGITAQGEGLAKLRKLPPAGYMPEGYVSPPGTEVPRMGAHWIDPTSAEFQGRAFTRTFLYGSYDGRLAFIEPMISKDFLETKPDVTENIKLPAKYARRAYYPTRYTVRYDPVTREYTVALEGMTLR